MTDFLDRPIGWTPPSFADVYDETSLWSARFGALLFDNLEIRRGIRGLDVGCGTGFPLIELAQLHGKSSHFTGVDIWPEALDRAQRKLAAYGLTNVDVVQADAIAMPLPDAAFDLVVSNLGVNNFPDVERVFRECRRVAKAGARFALTTNVRGHFGEAYRLLDGILREGGLTDTRARLERDEDHRHPEDKLAASLAAAGFSTVRANTRNFAMRFADGSTLLRHSLVKWFVDGWREALGPDHERQVLALLEQRMNAAAERIGSIEMTVPMLYLESIAR